MTFRWCSFPAGAVDWAIGVSCSVAVLSITITGASSPTLGADHATLAEEEDVAADAHVVAALSMDEHAEAYVTVRTTPDTMRGFVIPRPAADAAPAMAMASTAPASVEIAPLFDKLTISGAGETKAPAPIACAVAAADAAMRRAVQQVHGVMRLFMGELGITPPEVCKHLPSLSRAVVWEAIVYLCEEGIAYTTIDDDHFMLQGHPAEAALEESCPEA